MSLEMAQKVIVPQKKNYVPQFLKQRDINSYCVRLEEHCKFKNQPQSLFSANLSALLSSLMLHSLPIS
jgi:hypothetical protein